MLEKLSELEKKYEELTEKLSNAASSSDRSRYSMLAKEMAELEPILNGTRELKKVEQELKDATELLNSGDDKDLKELAEEEIEGLGARRDELIEELKTLLAPKDPNDEKNVVLEIRAGTGGEEAALFAAEIFRMFSRYAELKGWKVKTTDTHETGAGGIKEVTALIEGRGVYSRLKYESGVHRVQRVPQTEASGRIHTSAITVAVLPEADDVEVEINEAELRIDRFCSSGPGGQSVNTTYSAVRITHLPTGLVVSCQDEKSQHKNKAQAMKVLKSRLYDIKLREQQESIAANRRGQVGSGDRSEKIRTYNFPQNRVTDHRIGLTIHQLSEVLEGKLDEIIDALSTHFQAERLKEGVDTLGG
ncbi:MAG TPA: peptide chain release factor 1 [Acidobacteriota bacterium]|nr:peptide chain release factor 1 [Acidobacteriota bacterium]